MLDWLPDLDKNGAYVWAAYGLSFLVIAVLIGLVIARARTARARLARLQRASGANGETEARS